MYLKLGPVILSIFIFQKNENTKRVFADKTYTHPNKKSFDFCPVITDNRVLQTVNIHPSLASHYCIINNTATEFPGWAVLC